MNNQPKTHGAMVSVDLQVLRELKEDADQLGETLDGVSLAELAELERKYAAEQTPAVGELDWSKSVYEHCRSCKGWLPLLDGSCRPCIELRAALARIAELEGQPPAVGGEPKVVAYLCNAGTVLMLADQKNAAAWNAGHPLIELQDHRAHVAPLLAENRLLKHDVASYLETMAKTCELLGIDLDNAKHADGKPSDVLFSHAKAMRARIAELEAQQGEPVYQTCNGVDGWIDVDRLRYTASRLDPEECECRVLYSATPATAKVVLPERMSQPSRDEYESTDHYAAALHEVKTWNGINP